MRPHISTGHSLRKRFVDTFQRTDTSGDPGIAGDGSRWNILTGLFTVVGNVLTTATPASSYPVASTEMGVENVSLEITSPAQGAMAALWVTDAGNWWGVQTFSQGESCNCSQYSYNCNCVPRSSSGCNTCYYGTYTCGSGYYGTYYCTAASYSPGYCVAYGGSYYYCIVWVGSSYTAGSCYADSYSYCIPNSYQCGCWSSSWSECSTCYATSCSTCYPQYFKVLRAVSGSVTSMWSQVIAAVAAAFRVKTSGDLITIQAYSDSNMATQIGSDLTYTASGAAKSTKFGLAIAPSSYNQVSNISKITIDRN